MIRGNDVNGGLTYSTSQNAIRRANALQGQQNQINNKINFGKQLWNPYFNDRGNTTTGLNLADAAAKLGYEYRGTENNPNNVLMTFRGFAEDAGLDPYGAEAEEFESIFNQYRTGNQARPQAGLTSSTALNDYTDTFQQLTKPKQMGGFGKTLGSIVKVGVPAAMGLGVGAALAPALGIGALGKGALSGSVGSTLKGGNPIEGAGISALTAGLGDLVNFGGEVAQTGLSAGNSAPSVISNISDLAKNAYEAIPSLGNYGNSIAQGAIKGGLVGAVAGEEPLDTALTGGLLGGASQLGSDVLDIVSDFTSPPVEGTTENLLNTDSGYRASSAENIQTSIPQNTGGSGLNFEDFATPKNLLSLAGLGTSLYGAYSGRKAAESAADAQIQSSREAIESQENALNTVRNDLAPYRDAGTEALGGLTSLVNDPNAQAEYIRSNPMYATLADDAQQRLLANAAARGKVGSGGTADDLQTNLLILGQQLLNQNIDQRQNVASLGQNAAAGTGSATLNTANNIGNLITDQGNAAASGQIGGANATTNAINNALNSAITLYGIDNGVFV